MATFAELLAAEDSGVVWLLDISFDDFATVSYRYSTASVIDDSGNSYDGRIADISTIERGFGRDHMPAASTTRLRIDNRDFAADWMIDRATVASQLLQARFKLTVMLYQSRNYATAASLTSASRVVAYFTCLDQPEADSNVITISLADDSLGRLAEVAVSPTIRDWATAYPNAADSENPFIRHDPLAGPMDWDTPIPLVFGAGAVGVEVPVYPSVVEYRDYQSPPIAWDRLFGHLAVVNGAQTVPVKFPLIVCASKSGNYTGGNEITKLYATLGNDCGGKPAMRGQTIEIPRTFKAYQEGANGTIGLLDFEMWRPRRSPVITKSGKQWEIVWIELNVDYFAHYFHITYDETVLNAQGGSINGPNNALPEAGQTSAAVAAATTSGGLTSGSRGSFVGAFSAWACGSDNFGAFSVVTTSQVLFAGSKYAPSQLLVDIIHDVIAYYSKASSTDIDETTFTRARAARSSVLGAGIIQPARPRPAPAQQRNTWLSPNPRDGIVGVLRTALGEMCASADVDLYMTNNGQYALATNVFDFAAVTGTRTAIDETRAQNVKTRTPSQGERWAPYNRVNLTGPGGQTFGPFDNQTAIDAWGIAIPLTIQGKWNASLWENAAAGASSVWAYRTLESVVRPTITFTTDRAYLTMDLGDYFTFTWTRGGGGQFYSGTIFKVEDMRIDPVTLGVQITAVWADDLATTHPYLLDDENYLLVASQSTIGGTVTVQNSVGTVTFSNAVVSPAGVQIGDILVLKDATQADNVFTRYRALRINDNSIDEFTLGITDASLDFGSAAPVAVSTWEIRHGKTTYPDSVSDPTHYPNDGTMYGKACNSSFLYSDSSAANKLLDG